MMLEIQTLCSNRAGHVLARLLEHGNNRFACRPDILSLLVTVGNTKYANCNAQATAHASLLPTPPTSLQPRLPPTATLFPYVALARSWTMPSAMLILRVA